MSSTFGDGERGEAEAERMAEMEQMHLPMKKWYHSDAAPSVHKEAWGAFPAFWKEAVGWEPYREVRKAFLAFQDGVEYTPTPAAPAAANTEDGAGAQGAQPDAAPAVDGAATPGACEAAGAQACAASRGGGNQAEKSYDEKSYDELREERKALWGTKRKSRFNAKKDSVALAAKGLNPDGTPMTSEQKEAAALGAKFGAAGVLAKVNAKHRGADLSPEQEQEVALNIVRVAALSQSLLTVARDAAVESLDPNRPPSPAPIYDAFGQKTNTREVRLRNRLKFERDGLIKQILKLKPHYHTPSDYVREKPRKKLYIPIKEYPNYNFIGLVIGPRGSTQKNMEKETGAKIVIRGRGSVKEGARARNDGGADDEDQLHVLITGESDEQVEHAVKLVMPLLQPMDDTVNVHKQTQLQQLAKLNGTEKDPLAAHARFNEQMGPTRNYMANVKCAICGEPHATRDCAHAPRPGATAAPGANGLPGLPPPAGLPGLPPPMGGAAPPAAPPPPNMDQEYANFMAELSGEPTPAEKRTKTGGGGGDAPPPPPPMHQQHQQHQPPPPQQAQPAAPWMPPPPPLPVAGSAPDPSQPPPPPPQAPGGYQHVDPYAQQQQQYPPQGYSQHAQHQPNGGGYHDPYGQQQQQEQMPQQQQQAHYGGGGYPQQQQHQQQAYGGGGYPMQPPPHEQQYQQHHHQQQAYGGGGYPPQPPVPPQQQFQYGNGGYGGGHVSAAASYHTSGH